MDIDMKNYFVIFK